MAAQKKFKKKLRPPHPKKEDKVITFSWESQLLKSFNFKLFPNLKIILPTVALFLFSLLMLLVGSKSLQRIDSALAFSNQAVVQESSIALPAVAGVAKAPEVKIVAKNNPQPDFTAWAIVAEDFDSRQLLYQKDSHTSHAPASTTKLMTALVGTDYFKNSDVLTVGKDDLVGGSIIGLRPGEKISFRSLLYGMLLNSGNDAAFTIASNYPGGVAAFVGKMNEKSADLGLTDTHFTNPAGFDDPDHYSSAFDLAQIAKEVAKNYQLARIVDTTETTVYSLTPSEASSASKISHQLKNLNQLLGEPGILGMKTGTTEKAGESLVTLVERNSHKVIIVMLGSKDRFNETRNLINWIYTNYSWVNQ